MSVRDVFQKSVLRFKQLLNVSNIRGRKLEIHQPDIHSFEKKFGLIKKEEILYYRLKLIRVYFFFCVYMLCLLRRFSLALVGLNLKKKRVNKYPRD